MNRTDRLYGPFAAAGRAARNKILLAMSVDDREAAEERDPSSFIQQAAQRDFEEVLG